MGSPVVVALDEDVEQCLELGDSGGLCGVGAQPLFEGLVGAFDLPAGGGVIGSRVLLADTECSKFGLEAVAAPASAGEARGEDHAVVRERGCWSPKTGHGSAEPVEDGLAGDAAMCGHGQRVAGVVV